MKNILDNIYRKKKKVLLIGDIMLDRYLAGSVERISPEAPVPILNFNSEEYKLGGVGNVFANLTNLGCEVEIGTIIGHDHYGGKILNLIKKNSQKIEKVIVDKDINTTVKTRIVSNGSQLLRVDRDSNKIKLRSINLLKNITFKKLMKFDFIIISDYNKGVCHSSLIVSLIKKANKLSIPVFIDPKGVEWDKYQDAFCITPNTSEVENYFGEKISTNDAFEDAGKKIVSSLNIKFCLITRGEDGMSFTDGKKTIHQKCPIKNVFDVSGAGDTAISTFALGITSKLSIQDSLYFSSIASSEVVSYSGTTPITKEILKNIIT